MGYGEEKWLIAVCGLNCASCFMYYKRDQSDPDVQREIRETIKWFGEERNLELSEEDLVCKSCLGPLDVHWSPDCAMMLCAREKALKHCFECKDFPCALTQEFATNGWKHHKRAVEDSTRIKEIGFKAWMAEQEEKR